MDKWTSRWLSLGGRLLLITAVLQGILVYWFSLFKVLKGIIDKMRKMIFHFLWAGKQKSFKFHLVEWEAISKPQFLGGWGIKNLSFFNLALCAKCISRCLFDNGLWGKVIRVKYLKNIPLSIWLRNKCKTTTTSSEIWRSVTKTLPFIAGDLGWMIGRGVQVYIGIGPIIGML